MATKIEKVSLDELRGVIPKGQTPPPPHPGGTGSGDMVLPSFEIPYEDWNDYWNLESEGQGDGKPQDSDPKEGKGGGLNEELKKLARDYSTSISAEVDKSKEEAIKASKAPFEKVDKGVGTGAGAQAGAQTPSGAFDNAKSSTQEKGKKKKMTREQYEIFKSRFKENLSTVMGNGKMRPGVVDVPHESSRRSQTQGYGMGGEFMAIGYAPPSRRVWKKILKNWVASILKERPGSSWVKKNVRTMSVISQMKRFGNNIKLKSYDIPGAKPVMYKILCFVDTSGSIYDIKVQTDFASVLKGFPKDKVEILIWQFDDGLQQGPFTPQRYTTVRGGGGTEPWAPITKVSTHPKYRDWDAIIVMTDGFFSPPPEGLIREPKKWCFILTHGSSKEALPGGVKIIEAFKENPEYWEQQVDKETEETTKRKK
jgi:hypothetical protein